MGGDSTTPAIGTPGARAGVGVVNSIHRQISVVCIDANLKVISSRVVDADCST